MEVCRFFGETYCHRLQSIRVSLSEDIKHVYLLPRLLSCLRATCRPLDTESTFFRNVGKLQPGYMESYPEGSFLRSHSLLDPILRKSNPVASLTMYFISREFSKQSEKATGRFLAGTRDYSLLHSFWSPLIFLFNGYREVVPRGMNLTIHFHLLLL
jgi:hypothetical protein